jgi:predicted aspartyl protease
MIKIKISADEPIVFFIRIKGPKGIREFRAILDTGSTYCAIPLQDARELGYDAYYDDFSKTGEATKGISKMGILETDELELEEVIVADLVARNVKALTWDLPKFTGIEAVLGMSFLCHFNTCLDFKQGYLTITPIS